MNLIKLSLKNYLSYKKCELDFKDKESLYLIIGRNSEEVDDTEGNGAGKTALISAIPFALFGRSRGVFDKDLNNEDVIYVDENGERASKCEVTIEFEIIDRRYKVIRTVTQKGSQKLSFYGKGYNSPAQDLWTELTLKAGVNKRTGKRENGITRTEQRISDTLGCDVNLFINSVYFEQSNIDTFARGTLSEKDGLIKTAIQSDKWNDYSQIISKDLSNLEKEIVKVETLLEDNYSDQKIYETINYNKARVKDLKAYIKKGEKSIVDNEKERENLIADIITFQKQVENFDNNKKEIEAKQKKLSHLKNRVNEINFEATKMAEEINLFNQRIRSYDSKIGEFVRKKKNEEKALDTVYTQQYAEELHNEINRLNGSMGKALAQVENIVEKGQNVDKMACPYNFECDKIDEKAKEQIKSLYRIEYKKRKSELNAIEKQLTKNKNLLVKVRNNLNAQINIKELTNNISNTEELKNKDLKSIQNIQNRIPTVNKTKEAVINEIKELEEKLNKTNESVNVEYLKVEMNKKIEIKDKIVADIESLRLEINEASGEIKLLEEQNKGFEKELQNIEKLKSAREKMIDEKMYKKYSLDMVRKHIPHLLISNAIPEIEDYAKEFIYKLSSGRMDINFNMIKDLKSKNDGKVNQTNSFDVVLTIDGRELKYEQASGGERARADVAIHLAYVVFISNRSNTRFETLFLDEVGAALDKKGVENFVDIIKEIQIAYGFKKVFNITQNIEMKRLIDNRITVTKTSDGSTIEMI